MHSLFIIMNQLLYKISGWTLIIAGIIITLYVLGYSLCTTCGVIDFVGEMVGGLLLGALVIVLSYFPGRFYLRLKKREENKLVKGSLICVLLVLFGFVLYLILGVYHLLIGTEDWGLLMMFGFIIFFAIPFGVLYGIALLLLIINRLRN